MEIAELAERMAFRMSETEARLVQQIDSIRREIRERPNYRKVRRAWMPLGEYVRSRFPAEQHEAKKRWIRRRLTIGCGPDPDFIRSQKPQGRLEIHTGDADHLLGFEES